MAEKGFGVKEVNLIGPSGTPTITSPNNLNLNAVNVAISTNVSIGGTLSVTGNVSIGGTLTYEDVTNIDSVGIVTAREGIKLPDDKQITFGADGDGVVKTDGSGNFIIQGGGGGTGTTYVRGRTLRLSANGGSGGYNGAVTIDKSGDERVQLKYGSGTKLVTTSSGITVTGTLTATTFSGSGASLTSLPAANLTGTLPAISGANLTGITITPTNSDIQVVYAVTANGSSAYRFAGNGVVSTADNPDLYLIRGQKYRFINNSGGSHPFQIRESSGGTAYSTGVTNNGASSGNIDFAPTFDSPAQLVYQCTSHGGMVGNIYLRDAAGQNRNVGLTTFAAGIDVDGHTNLDNVSIAGVTTITGSGNALEIVGGLVRSRNTASARFVANNGSAEGYFGWSSGVLTVGQAAATLSLEATGSNHIQLKTNGSERLRITSDGQIGVNNSSPDAWHPSYRSIQIHDAGVLYGSQDDSFVGLGANHYLNTSGNFIYSNSDFASRFYHVNGEFYFESAASGTAGNSFSFTQRLRITSTGQIRIDQATSANNGIRIRPSGWNYDFRIGAVSSSGGSIWLGQNYEPTGGTRDSASYGTNYIQFTTGGTIHFGTGATNTNPTERLGIAASGIVTKPYLPAWSMHGTGVQSLSSSTKLAFSVNGTGFGSFANRNHGGVDTSAYSYTVPVTGLYSVSVVIFFYSNSNTNTFSIVPRINGNELNNGTDTVFFCGMKPYQNNGTISGTLLLQLSADDEITVHRRNGESGSDNVYLAHSVFMGHLVG